MEALRHPRHGHSPARRAETTHPAAGQCGIRRRVHCAGERGGGSAFPVLPVRLGGDGHGGDGVRQGRARLCHPGPQRPGDSAEVRSVRGALRPAGLLHEQRRAAGGSRRRLHHPRISEEPAQALQRHDGAEISVRHEVQRPRARRQRPGAVRGRHHLLRR